LSGIPTLQVFLVTDGQDDPYGTDHNEARRVLQQAAEMSGQESSGEGLDRVATAREIVGGVGGPATPNAREHIVDSGLGWLISTEK
jgi:hypothetical protein